MILNALKGILVCSLVILLSLAVEPSSATAKDFYAGKTVRLMVPFSPGGGADIYSRLAARHLGKHIPGNPTIIVQNMTGAGGQVLWNWGYNAAKPDGLTLLLGTGSFPIKKILNVPGVQYDYKKVPILAGMRIDPPVFGIRTAIGKTAEDLAKHKKQIFVPGQSGTNITFMLMGLAVDLLGVKWKPVLGYGGLADVRLTLRRGDGDIHLESGGSYLVGVGPMEKEGIATRIMQVGFLNAKGNWDRHPQFPKTPTFPEVYRKVFGKDPSGPQYEAYKLAGATYGFTSYYWLPPGTPKDRVEILSSAFEKMRHDPDYKAGSRKIYGFEIFSSPLSEGSAALEKVLRAAPEEALEAMKKFVKIQGG